MTSEELARAIRADALRMTAATKASHIGSCLSIADILAVLYTGTLRVRANEPHWPLRDRLVVSKGHAAAIVYAVLARVGFFDVAELATYTQNGAAFTGHVSHHVPGVEWSTGSLGHGLPVAAGMALANQRMRGEQRRAGEYPEAQRAGVQQTVVQRTDAKHVNAERTDTQRTDPLRTFALLSDGELDEGSNWEAIMFAGHHKLRNLTAIVDANGIQSFGSVSEVLELEPLPQKFHNFGWRVLEVNGHDHDVLRVSLQSAPANDDRPTVVIARTTKGAGVSFMENKLRWHYRSANAEELAAALAEVGSVA